MKKIVTIMATMLIAAMAMAQQPTPLSFGAAIEMTVRDNPSMRASQAQERMAEQQVKAAQGLRMPSINVTGAYNYMSKDIGIDLNGLKGPIGGIAGGIGGLLPPEILGQVAELMKHDWNIMVQDRSFGAVGASLTMPLYTGGKINAANNAAKIKLAQTRAQGEGSQGSLISELTERYWGLALAQAALEVRQDVAQGMKHHLSDAQKMEQTGVISKAELLYAQMHLAGAERELIAAQRQVATITQALRSTLGVEGDADFEITSPMFILQSTQDIDHYRELAAKHNPALVRAALSRNLALEGVRLQRAEFAPQVALMGGASLYSYQVTHLLPRWTVGVGVQLKIFDGLSRERKYSAAKQQVKMVESLGDGARSEVTTAIEKLYNQLHVYSAQMPSVESSLLFAQEYLRVKEAGFAEGVNSAVEVVDARLNLSKIRMERLQTAYYYDLVLAKLMEVCGTPHAMEQLAASPSAIAITNN